MVTIKGKDYNVKNTIRTLMLYERAMGKSVEINDTMDRMFYLYFVILGSNPECELSMDEFIDEVDNNPKLVDDISSQLTMKDMSVVEADGSNEGEKKN